jgi:hypothetical protein
MKTRRLRRRMGAQGAREYKQLETLEDVLVAIGWVDGLVSGVVVRWRSFVAAALSYPLLRPVNPYLGRSIMRD